MAPRRGRPSDKMFAIVTQLYALETRCFKASYYYLHTGIRIESGRSTMAKRRIRLAALAILIGLLPATASAYHRNHIQRHHWARHHAPGLHFYPVLPLYAPYAAAPAPTVVEVEAHPVAGASSKLFAYPAQGQSEQLQAQDRYECHSWAARESGFDPVVAASSPPVTPVAPAPGSRTGPSDPITGAAGGAALGAMGGAIAGDPGIGAAIGAAVGGAVGLANQADQGAKQRAAIRQAAARNAQHATARASQQTDYTRAMSTCLVARGYVVS